MVKIVKISREEANRRLGNVMDEKRFWCQDGKVINNLKELQEAFNGMSDETFSYHSREDRHDFSNWTRDVVGDGKLANDLIRAKSRIQAGKAVAQRISFLQSKI